MNVHYVKVKVGGMDVDEKAALLTTTAGDINVPSVDDIVVIAYLKGESPIVIGQAYTAQSSDSVKSYVMGHRRLGHTTTESDVFFDAQGNVKVEEDYEDTSTPSDPNADYSTNYDPLRESQRDGVDQSDYTGSWMELRNGNQFFSPSQGGTTYGVGEPFSGVIASRPSESPTQSAPYTEFVELGFRPSRVEFQAQLHQEPWNKPYYSSDSSQSHANEASASSEGRMSLHPLSVPDYVRNETDASYPVSESSDTEGRFDGEPFTDTQYNNPTQLCQSSASFGSATEARSYQGDDQCIRLIHCDDASLTEKYRVEMRVSEVTENGFVVEWFISDSDEPNAKYNTDYQMPVHFTAYQ